MRVKLNRNVTQNQNNENTQVIKIFRLLSIVIDLRSLVVCTLTSRYRGNATVRSEPSSPGGVFVGSEKWSMSDVLRQKYSLQRDSE